MKYLKILLLLFIPAFTFCQHRDTLKIKMKGRSVIVITQSDVDSSNGVTDTIKTINGPSVTKLTFTFSVAEGSTCAAGLYRGSNLIRTFFSNKYYDAGTHNEEYVPVDDNLDTITDLTGTHVEVTRSNSEYNWDGIAGNTSTLNSGDNIHQGLQQIVAIAVTPSKVYYSKGYSEGTMPYNYFDVSDIQTRSKLFPTETSRCNAVVDNMCTDGNYVYWAGLDPFAPQYGRIYRYASFVFATKVSDNSEVTFSGGVPYTSALGRYYKSTVDFSSDTLFPVTGLAVQSSGNFLFIARTTRIDVVNKSTGALVTTNTLPCERIATDGNYLWVLIGTTAKRYAVSVGGVLTLSSTISGFSNPLAVTVNSDTVVIADGGNSQQVKAFNTSTGSAYWTLGTAGGYYKSAAASNYKFYFDDSLSYQAAYLGYASDGSLWVVDGGNARLLHFSAGRTYLENIQYVPNSYNVYCDPNEPTRLFSDYQEFEIDYSKPLQSGNGSWTFKANWQNDPFILRNYSQAYTIRPIKLSNGRTYTLAPDNYGITYAGRYRFQVLELTGDSLRQTGKYVQPFDVGYLHWDGDLYFMPNKVIGKPMTYYKRNLTGFTSNNPVWGSDSIISTMNYQTKDPSYSGNRSSLRPGERTSDNKLIVFEASGGFTGYHLGALAYGDTSFTWRSARATHKQYMGTYPSDEAYDIGNSVQYAGNVALCLDDQILWGYHGEFWKGTQTNKWNHLAKNGLMVGQFGVVGSDLRGNSVAQMSGNVSSASMVKVGDTLYLWHNDEGHHSGVHRWSIKNYSSVITDTVTPALSLIGIDTTITNLMDSLPYAAVLVNGTGGWYRSPVNEVHTDWSRDYWSVLTNSKSYNIFTNPDIYLNYVNKYYAPVGASIYKQLPATNQDTWSLSGQINYDGNYPSVDQIKTDTSGSGAVFLDVVDINNKVLVRLYSKHDASKQFIDYYANTQLLWRDSSFTSQLASKYWQNYSVTNTSGSLAISYAGHSITGLAPLDATADKSRPDKIRVYLWSKAANNPRRIGLKDFIFDK